MTPQRHTQRHIDQAMRAACESAAPQAGEGQRSGDQPGDGARTEVDAWLDTVARLLPAGEAGRASIREELESHVRDRVTDLMVLGHTEAEAVRLAVEEFGGAAEFARSFRRAKRGFFRRHAMHISVLAVAGSALGLSLFAVTNPQAIPGGVPERAQVFEAPQTANPYADLEVKIEPGTYELREVMGEAADKLGLKLDSPNTILFQIAIEIDIEREITTLGELFEVVNDQVGLNQELGYEVTEEALHVQPAMRSAGQAVLVSYDIGDLIHNDRYIETMGEQIVTTLNIHAAFGAGDKSDVSITAVGLRLFISAPREAHARIAWLLEQMAHDKESEQSEEARSQTAQAEHEVRIVEVEHAANVAGTLYSVFEGRIDQLSDPRSAITHFPPTNTIILNMPADLADRVEDLARRLDEIASQRESADANGEGADRMRQQAIERRQRMLRQRQQREPN